MVANVLLCRCCSCRSFVGRTWGSRDCFLCRKRRLAPATRDCIDRTYCNDDLRFCLCSCFLFSVLGVLNVLCSSSASRSSSFSSGGGGGDLGLLQFGKCWGASEGNRKRKRGPWKGFDETQSDGKILEVVSSLFWRFRVRRSRSQPAAEFGSWTSWKRFWPLNTVVWRWSYVM